MTRAMGSTVMSVVSMSRDVASLISWKRGNWPVLRTMTSGDDWASAKLRRSAATSMTLFWDAEALKWMVEITVALSRDSESVARMHRLGLSMNSK